MRHSRARRVGGVGHLIDRRTFLGACLAGLLAPAACLAGAGTASPPRRSGALAPELTRALEKSPFVYVSPLRSDGRESACHGEVWYGWLDGSVVLITSAESWKARSLDRGLERARLWVGDYGRWKRVVGRNEAFRSGPSFEARATVAREEALLERLLEVYQRKYPEEIGRWRERFRSGFADGTRVLIRYAPAADERSPRT